MSRRASFAAVILSLPLLAAACSDVRDPITVSDGTIAIENQTPREWRKVVVTVNDHFRAGAERLAPGGRLTAPLAQLQTAFGQRFDIRRQSVFKVEVAATDDQGKPVALRWGQSPRPASRGGKP